jgi:hypothetical protein
MTSYAPTIIYRVIAQPKIVATNAELLVNQRIGWVFYGLVVIFWLGQLWCSPYASFDNNLEYGGNPLYAHHLNFIMRYIDRFLDDFTLVGKRFSRYEVCLGAMSLYILVVFKKFRRMEKFPAIFFFVSLLTVLLSLLNPNNSFDDVKYLLTIDPRILYLYVLFLYSFTFLRADVLSVILKKFFVIGSYAAIILAAYSLFFFMIGKGPVFFGHMTTLPNAEHLDLLAIFSAIFLVLYLRSRKKSYLTYVILFHLVVIFGDRRTQTAILLSSDVMILAYYLKENMFKKLRKFIFTGSILAIGVLLIVWVSGIDASHYFARFHSVFATESYSGALYSDSGHWEQTTATFKTMLDNLDKLDRFWGAGIRNEMNYVEGQSAYIHNSFVAVWSIHGLHMSIFYILLLAVFLYKTISLYLGKISESTMIIAAVTFSYLMIIIGTAFTGEFIFKNFLYAPQVALILSVFKFGMGKPLTLAHSRKINR